MRGLADSNRIGEFMRILGRSARHPCRIYFTGGTTAVLYGWRESTVDIDLSFSPESDEIFRALPELKELLNVNIELASPSDFIPPLPGWEERSIFIVREGRIDFFHLDPYSQALAKIERWHAKDVDDINDMKASGLVGTRELVELFEKIEPDLYRYPAIDPPTFRRSVILFAGEDAA